MPRGFLTAEWRYLAMLNYEIDPAVVRPFIPAGTELDCCQGRAFASVVGFLFLRTKVLGATIPFHRNFEEVNLRFYVRRKAEGVWRRGVVFIKEIVPRWAIATVARVVYNENYVAMPMRHQVSTTGDAGRKLVSAEYAWRHHGQWSRLRIEALGEPLPALAGSEAEFITEHYWGYAAQRDGGTVEYEVEHPRWLVWQATERRLECDVAAIYGDRFGSALGAEPTSAFLAQGSPVLVRRGCKIV